MTARYTIRRIRDKPPQTTTHPHFGFAEEFE
jgi:hypothetical protein